MKVEILEINTGKLVGAAITKIKDVDFDIIESIGAFKTFNWHERRSSKHEIYKLSKNGTILGLVQFFYQSFYQAVEINILESSIDNVGRNKKYDHIAGCLISYACLHSLKKYSGDVIAMHKKETKDNYLIKYSMELYQQHFVRSNRNNSISLVAKYLKLVL